MTIIAGAGTNDTRHAVELTERATRARRRRDPLGDALLQPAQPRAASCATTRRSPQPPTCRSCSTTSPARTGTNMPPDLLAELAQIEGIDAVKQANADELQLVDGLELYAGNDAHVRAHARHRRGRRDLRRQPHRRRRDAADGRRARARAEIDASLRDVYETLFLTASPTCMKAALNLLGHRVGGLRLPLVEATDERASAQAVRAMLETPRPLLRTSSRARARARVSARCASCRSAAWARSART